MENDPSQTAWSSRCLVIRSVSGCLGYQAVGGQHDRKNQQWQDHRPRKFGIGESDMENDRQEDGGQPADAVLLDEFGFGGLGHVGIRECCPAAFRLVSFRLGLARVIWSKGGR